MNLKHLFIPGLLIAFSSPAMALKVIETEPGVSQDVIVSSNEFTLFSVEDQAIVRLDGKDFYDNADRDKGFGKAFIKPASAKNFTLYITTDKGKTYPVSVIPSKKVSGDVVVIRDVSKIKELASGDPAIMERSDYRSKMVEKIMRAMVQRTEPKDMSVTKTDMEIAWWNESKVHLKREYKYKSIVGRIYELTNISGKRMIMSDDEFFTPGMIAIGIQYPVLDPDESSFVYVISSDLE